MLRPLSRIKAPKALGAVAAQLTQALASFVLQVIAARELGAQGFGIYAFMLGSIVMATALTTGLVGDSLTVLDRGRRAVRVALVTVAFVVVGVATAAAFVLGVSVGGLSWHTSLAFAAALGTFTAEDLGRRVLMADLHFWRIVVVDATVFLVSLGTLAVAAALGSITLDGFLVAIILGQVSGGIVAFLSLRRRRRAGPKPEAEPDAAHAVRTQILTVLRFGTWRAAQQFVRPTMLNLARFVVLVVASQAAVGELEAARVFVAPAMLLVQGVGYYLFATYAQGRDLPTSALLARADRASVRLLLGAVLVGGITAAAVPLLEDVMTAGNFDLSVVAVLGWAVYAASIAAVMPFGSLATVRGRQAPFLAFRTADSLVSVGLVAAGIGLLSIPVDWAPWLLSVGSFAGGLFCRQLLLSPMATAEDSGGRPEQAGDSIPADR